MAGRMKVWISADHGGFALKETLKAYLSKKGHKVTDAGPDSGDPCDYPEFGYKTAKAVSSKKADYGIAICKTGFGMAIIANKLRGVRSAVCDSPAEALSARQHNDCNVLALAATRVSAAVAKKITDVFLKTKREEGRHARRVRQIIRLERKK